MTTASKYLATYLNDHLGGATAGVGLVRRTAADKRGAGVRRLLSALTARSRPTGRRSSGDGRLGVKPDRAKVAAGWAAEKVDG